MDRREFLKTTGAVAAAAAAATPATADIMAQSHAADVAPAIISGRRELVVASLWPDSVAGPADSARRLARRIETMSEGRWRFSFAGVAGSGLEAVMTGAADAYHATEHHHTGFNPALGYLAGLPAFTGLDAPDLKGWLDVGGGQELWDTIAAAFNVKALVAGHGGRWPGLWSRAPIDSLADLKGARVYVLGLARDVARGIGAEPVAMPAGEVASALACGDLAAAEWGGGLAAHALGLHEAAKHRVGFGINNAGSAYSFGVRRTMWEAMSDADRALFETAAATEFHLTLTEARAHEAMFAAVFAAAGVAAQPFPDDVMGALSRVADAVVAHAAGSDANARALDRSYMAYRAAVTGLPPAAPVA